MNEKEKASYFDRILIILKENNYRSETQALSEKLGIELHESNSLCTTLSEEYNIIELRNINLGDPRRYRVWLKEEPRILEDNHFTNLYNQKQAKKQKEEDFKELQLVEIKRRLDAYENTSKFHKTSIDRNEKQLELIESQLPYFKIAKATIIAAIILSLFSLGVAIFTYFK